MSEAATKTKVARGLTWVGAASSVVGALDFIASLLVLRYWITPEEYGIASTVTTLFPMLEYATDLGISSSIIQRRDTTREQLSSLFWVNVGVTLLVMTLVAGVSPFFAALHGHTMLMWMLLAYCGKLLYQSVWTIPHALLRRDLRFREVSIARIVANLAEFGCKIGFAAAGFGAWTYVLAMLARNVVFGLLLQWYQPFLPGFLLRLNEVRPYLKFGLRTSASQVLFQLYTNIDYQVVSFFFGDAANGYYRLAYELVLEPVRIIAGVVQDIAFPIFSRLQQDRDRLIEQFVFFTRLNFVVVATFMVAVWLCADEIVVAAYGPEWQTVSLAARVLAFAGLLRAVSAVIPPLLDGIGEPALTLRYTTIAAVTLTTLYVAFAAWLGPSFGYVSVALAWATGYPVAFAALMVLALRRLHLSFHRYVGRIVGVVTCTAIAFAVGLVMHFATAQFPLAARLGLVLLPVALVQLALLARFQGMSLVAIVRAIRGGA